MIWTPEAIDRVDTPPPTLAEIHALLRQRDAVFDAVLAHIAAEQRKPPEPRP